MQSVALLMTKAGGFISSMAGGGAAAGAAGAATNTALLSTAVTTLGTFAALSMQSAAMRAAADAEEAEAKRIREAGMTAAQDIDFEYAALIAEEKARQGASGIAVNSGSFQRRRARLKTIGRTSALRAAHDAEVQSISLRNRAAVKRTEASGLRFQSIFTLASGAIDMRSDLISGAALAKRSAIGETQRTTIRT